MAAYAALISLMHIINQIEHHPNPPISLNKHQVESLTKNVTFLQEFLEGSRVGYIEEQIVDAAYAAEDVIESHIVDQILGGSTSSLDLHQGLLQKAIQDMDSIKKEVMEIKETTTRVQDQLQKNISTQVGSLRSGKNSTMVVGFDDVLLEIMDKLTGGRLDRQIIPIVGMGGIGKTTLARNVYANQLIKEHFDICAWTAISQEFNTQEILSQILSQVSKESKDQLSEINEDELGEKLYKSLSGRRYLIVLDDIWSIEAWDKMQFFFPDNNNGSRILITTRLSNLASHMGGSRGTDIALLNEDNSWSLFSELVFGEQGCPLELEEIGRKIAKSCRGLPLSIVVTGGLLAKSEHTQEYWDYIGENLNAIVNLENDEHCLRILKMSYDQLPVYLKPCFLYMGVFEEDRAIRVSTLVRLWVSEGFLKPINGKDMEIVANESLNDLIDRNLLLVHELGYNGNVKFCKIHDLLRDLCLREAERERFYHVIRQSSPHQLASTRHRIVIPESTSGEKALDVLQSASLARSLMCDYARFRFPINLRLLRILKAFDRDSYGGDKDFLGDIFQFVNSRYLAVRANRESNFPSSVYLLWNLQTLIVNPQFMKAFIAPVEIWNMPQLEHVEFPLGLHLPDPPSRDVHVLRNLQTLKTVVNFKCSEEMIASIPNIKKLGVEYRNDEGSSHNYHRENLDRLHKLESFRCSFTHGAPESLHKLTFPHSLKKLAMEGRIAHHWEDVLVKIGSLPLLQKLSLRLGSFRTHKWETVECQFPSLKFLEVWECQYLEDWMTESSHFPRLEHLVLRSLRDLKEVPSDIGEIPTLKSIQLHSCSSSAVISARRVIEEQEEMYGEEAALHVRVWVWNRDKEAQRLQSLASANFQVDVY